MPRSAQAAAEAVYSPTSPAGFTMVMNAVIRAKLKSGPKTLYLTLASYNFGTNSESVTISQARLAQDCSTTIRTIRRWTRILEEQGWLAVYERLGQVSRYELLVPHHPNQNLRLVDEPNPGQKSPSSSSPPRTEQPESEPDPGQNQCSGNNSTKEPPSCSEEEKKPPQGLLDPWSKFRADPVVKAASKIANVNSLRRFQRGDTPRLNRV